MFRSRQRGSILIETVVAIPLLVLCAMLIVQGVVLASELGSIQVAAKDAARAAADSCSTVTPGQAARRSVADGVRVRDVQVSRDGDEYTSTVVVGLPLNVVHLTATEFEVSRSATMPRLSSCR